MASSSARCRKVLEMEVQPASRVGRSRVDSAVQSAEGSGMSFRSVVASMMRVAQVWATEGGS